MYLDYDKCLEQDIRFAKGNITSNRVKSCSLSQEAIFCTISALQ